MCWPRRSSLHTDQVLKYHIVPDTPLRLSDLADGMMIATNDGDEKLEISVDGSEVVVNGFANSARVTEGDIGAGDAFIHIVDSVLLPFDPASAVEEDEGPPPAAASVAALALEEPSLSVLVHAVVSAGMQDLIADASLVATVLAPNDEAFSNVVDALEIASSCRR